MELGSDANLPIPISALQHYGFCPRQVALIHVERRWNENVLTLRGRQVHEAVHEEGSRTRKGVRIECALPIWSDRLGLVGVADVVEFHRRDPPCPVEYKHGRRRDSKPDALQLCAQALCLEEMFQSRIPRGVLFYHSSRKRLVVELGEALRCETKKVIEAVRSLFSAGRLPAPANDSRCRQCSLRDECQPHLVSNRGILRRLHEELFQAEK